jgi:hypothetical protein
MEMSANGKMDGREEYLIKEHERHSTESAKLYFFKK